MAGRFSTAGAAGIAAGAAATACTRGAGSAGEVDAPGFEARVSIEAVVSSPLSDFALAVCAGAGPKRCQAPAPAATTAVKEPATIKKGSLRIFTPAPEAHLVSPLSEIVNHAYARRTLNEKI
jgi:hypothetical protein